ncbi:MAG: MBOAT family protein, partial [Chloroflexota bacterium]|nr:MBOAT family protein [Chloroflexota bacterium]
FWDWRFVFLIIASTIVNQWLAVWIDPRGYRWRRPLLVVAVAVNLGILGVFKYYGFFIDSINVSLHRLGIGTRLPVLEIIVPVGISFFTFQAITYIVDIYKGKIQPASLIDFAVYLAFFPHLVAGPIVRAAEFIPQLRQAQPVERRQASRAAWLIGFGLFKKVVIASNVATAIVDPVFALPGQHSAPEILLAVYGYAVQIYADFSGYTDMAIGIALLLGITFPQNFDRPYIAVSLQDFWRRWHMTLSRWLRDYLYIPLGGNRKGRWKTYRNLLLTMTLGGLWHGASLTFIAWGLFHGLGLAAERWLGERREARGVVEPEHASAGRQWLGRLLTFHLVCVGWVLFRSDNFGAAITILTRSVTAWGPAAPLVTINLLLVIAGALAMQYFPVHLSHRFEIAFAAPPLFVQGAVMGIVVALIFALGPKGVAPFIYYQF